MAKLGVRKTERYLPVGSVVTVVGELDESLLARWVQSISMIPFLQYFPLI